MHEPKEALISIHTIHAQGILCGTKTVELRRRFPHTESGSRLWIYETMPTGAVTGHATVERLERDEPEVLWGRHQDDLGIKRAMFDDYLRGCADAVAILLSEPCRIVPISTAVLRTVRHGFRPPQVMTRLSIGEARALWSLSRVQPAGAAKVRLTSATERVLGSGPPADAVMADRSSSAPSSMASNR